MSKQANSVKSFNVKILCGKSVSRMKENFLSHTGPEQQQNSFLWCKCQEKGEAQLLIKNGSSFLS